MCLKDTVVVVGCVCVATLVVGVFFLSVSLRAGSGRRPRHDQQKIGSDALYVTSVSALRK